jgi:hypothetical protein
VSISRRDFVSSLGLGILGLASPTLPPWLLETDEYDAPAFGFRLQKPPSWRFVAAREIAQAREEGQLPGGLEAKQEVVELAGAPLVVAAQLPEPQRGPALVIWRQPAEPGDLPAADHRSFALIHAATYRQYGAYLRDFTMLENAVPAAYAGRPASRCVVRFGEDTVRGESWTVRLESHLLRWRSSWLTFNHLDLDGGFGPAVRSDFRAIEASIRFFEPHVSAA